IKNPDKKTVAEYVISIGDNICNGGEKNYCSVCPARGDCGKKGETQKRIKIAKDYLNKVQEERFSKAKEILDIVELIESKKIISKSCGSCEYSGLDQTENPCCDCDSD